MSQLPHGDAAGRRCIDHGAVADTYAVVTVDNGRRPDRNRLRAHCQRVRRGRVRVKVQLPRYGERRQSAGKLPDGDRILRLRSVGDIDQLAIRISARAAEGHRPQQSLIGGIEGNRMGAIRN